jgi:hypothetical protein
MLDPIEGGEGSVDPLSLSRTYERLADRILPAVTVRMSRIRSRRPDQLQGRA